MNRIELFRWLILIPVTFIATGFLTALFAHVLIDIIKPFETGSDYDGFYSAAITSFAAIIWLTASYFIAPKYKKKVLWISYIIGCIISTLLLMEINSRNELHLILAISFTTFIGFVIAVMLHFGKNILNEIER
ncbi:MAG: hypothetical protein ACPGVH_00605 [Chitinophagales bacterium]